MESPGLLALHRSQSRQISKCADQLLKVASASVFEQSRDAARLAMVGATKLEELRVGLLDHPSALTPLTKGDETFAEESAGDGGLPVFPGQDFVEDGERPPQRLDRVGRPATSTATVTPISSS